jgi:dsDNA-specific endonuclease/ATPase MutS2
MENEAVRKSRQPDSIPIDEVPEGGMVWIVPLDRVAKLLKKKAGGKLELLSGGVRMTLAASDVIGIREGEPKKSKQKVSQYHGGGEFEAPEDEILLLGLTMEESIAVLEPFLDRHMLAGSEEVVVIHGRGPLKSKIEEFLKKSAYAKTFRTASPARGGDGATIVTLG